MGKRWRTAFNPLIYLFIVGSLAFNTYLSISFLGLKEKIEKFYQKDFVDVRVVSEQLVLDIENVYGLELPPVELNIRLSEYSDTGIKYKDNSSKSLQLFLPPGIIDFDSKQKRAYLAHEFGHYVLGHLDQQNFSNYSSLKNRDLSKEVGADYFTLRFSSVNELSFVIKILVWDKNERKTRLTSMGVT